MYLLLLPRSDTEEFIGIPLAAGLATRATAKSLGCGRGIGLVPVLHDVLDLVLRLEQAVGEGAAVQELAYGAGECVEERLQPIVAALDGFDIGSSLGLGLGELGFQLGDLVLGSFELLELILLGSVSLDQRVVIRESCRCAGIVAGRALRATLSRRFAGGLLLLVLLFRVFLGGGRFAQL